MRTSLLSSLLYTIAAAVCLCWQAASAAPHPGPQFSEVVPVVAPGACKSVGQFICVSDSTFAICNAVLEGVVQSLALGDNRCRSGHHGT